MSTLTLSCRHILSLCMATAVAPCLLAQSMSESVTVEGRYTPEIIRADRLAVLPAAVNLKAPESAMTYDRTGTVASFAPDGLNMAATAWRANRDFDTSRGYIDFRLGSWLNSSLSAGYSVINTPDTRLSAYLQHNSTSLFRAPLPGKLTTPEATTDRRYRYDETLGVELEKNFSRAGRLSADVQYHLGCFNYYGTILHAGDHDRKPKAPGQTLNDAYARVGWTGNTLGRYSYQAEADVRHFAYRSMFAPSPLEDDETVRTKGQRETAVNVSAEGGYHLSGESAISLGLAYSGVFNSIGSDVGRVALRPAYSQRGKAYTLHAGVDIAILDGRTGTRFRIAPDVDFSYKIGIGVISAGIGGGTHLRTLAWMHTLDYYSNPGYGCYEAAYSPIDFRLAGRLNPGGKWTFGAEFRWVAMFDEAIGGYYQALLNDNLATLKPDTFSSKLHGFSLSVDASYEFSRYFSLCGKGSWQPQKGKKGILNGFDRPEFTASLSAKSRPVDALTVSLDYSLRARRLLLPGNISRLNLGADYRISERISAGLEISNLLNRREEILPGLPSEGISAIAGFQIKF